jgi:hypothetical protein
MEESLFIDAVILEELPVVTEIPQEPVEFPKRFFRAVQTAGERARLEGLWFQDNELDLHKRLLRMPPVTRVFHANKK